jgi:hypothetical protein
MLEEQKVITHSRQLFSGEGPFVRDMYEVLRGLKEADFIDPTKVRVLAHSHDFERRPRLFRNEDHLERHYRQKNEPKYVPVNQQSIEYALMIAEKKKEFQHAYGEQPLPVYALELLDKKDKGGSYIEFKDLEGLIKGRIGYVKKEPSIYQELMGLAELGFGTLGGLFLIGVTKVLGLTLKDFTFYFLTAFGVGMVCYTLPDVLKRVSVHEYLETTITPTGDSKEAIEKAKSLADMLKKKFR